MKEEPNDMDDGAQQPLGGTGKRNDIVPTGSGDVDKLPPLELVEVIPGTAVVFGKVPKDLDLMDFGLVPSQDRTMLSTALGAIGNAGTIGGNAANAMSSAQGLYRINDATMSLLKSGGHLAVKDGANLGAVLKDGKIVAQARFVPISMTASAVAAIGPAVAMVGLQVQLNEITGLVRSNIALTEQTLQTIHQEQWAELAGLSKSINRAIDQAQQVGQVTTSIWENIAGNEAMLDKQLDLYRQKVDTHIRQLHQLEGEARRNYLKTHAESILFDSNALLYALKAQAGYQAVRAAHAQIAGQQDEGEARLAEVIERDMRNDITAGVQNARTLVASLIRELRVVAELPGRAAVPLTKSWRMAKSSQLSCQRLLDALEPLANTLHPMAESLDRPTLVCAPESVDLDAYLYILRWFMEDDEELKGLAFVYQPGEHDLAGIVPQVLGERVDAVWSALDSGAIASVIDKTTSGIFVAVTSDRVITASPRAFLSRGAIENVIPLTDIRFVRTPRRHDQEVRKTIDIITEQRDFRWMFPQEASAESIDALTELIAAGTSSEATLPQVDIDGDKESESARIDKGKLADRLPFREFRR